MQDCYQNPQVQDGIIDHRYLVKDVLGSGTTACVYKVRTKDDPHLYALKLLKPRFVAEPRVLRLFRREGQLLLELNNPNIVRFYEFKIHPVEAENPDYAYIVMDYIDGFTLKQLLESRTNPLPLEEAVILLVQAARALTYVHQYRLIHRDIKAANFLVEHSTGKLFLTDFGITTGVGLSENMLSGTRSYMPPEQHLGQNLTEQADLYAFAIVAYEMLAHRRPFVAINKTSYEEAAKELIEQHLKADVPSISRLRPELPARVDAIFARALAKDPAERYASARDFMNDLHAALLPLLPANLHKVDEIRNRPITMDVPIVPRSNQRLVFAALIAAFLLIGAALIGFGLLAGSDEESDNPEAAAPSMTLTATDTPTQTEQVTEAALDPTTATDVPATREGSSDALFTEEPAEAAPESATETRPASTHTATPSPDDTALPPSETSTFTPTFTATFTETPTPTPTDTPSPTPTFTPTLFLSDKVFLPIYEGGNLLLGGETDLEKALEFLAGQPTSFIPLNTGSVNGFRVELEVAADFENLNAYGIAFRAADSENHLRFSVLPASGEWRMEQIAAGQAQLLASGQAVAPFNRLMVMGLDDFFRIEIGGEVLQQQVSYTAEGTLALYFDLAAPGIPPVTTLQFGLVDSAAFAAATASPTPASHVTVEQYLQADVAALLSAGNIETVMLDCQAFITHYAALEKYQAFDAQIAERAAAVRDAGELLATECNRNQRSTTELSFMDAFNDFLEWYNTTRALLEDIRAE